MVVWFSSVRESHCGEDGGSEISGRMVRVERSKEVYERKMLNWLRSFNFFF